MTCFILFSQYTPAIDIWSIGCIFAEILTGKPLFPGKNVVHQLDLITDLFGTPEAEAIAKVGWIIYLLNQNVYKIHNFLIKHQSYVRIFTQIYSPLEPSLMHPYVFWINFKIRNEKARRYLGNMRKKPPVPFSRKFPNVDPSALRLLERLLAFDPKCRPTAAEVSGIYWPILLL